MTPRVFAHMFGPVAERRWQSHLRDDRVLRAVRNYPTAIDDRDRTEIAFCGSRRSIFFLWAVGMTNVGGLIAPEGILSDVRSMIPNPL